MLTGSRNFFAHLKRYLFLRWKRAIGKFKGPENSMLTKYLSLVNIDKNAQKTETYFYRKSIPLLNNSI